MPTSSWAPRIGLLNPGEPDDNTRHLDPMDLFGSFEAGGRNAAKNIGNLSSSFSGINSVGDVSGRFGLTSAKDTFAPYKKILESNRQRQLAGAATRGGRNASPEMTFSGIEQGAEDSLQGLLGQQGQAELGQNNQIASLLHSIMGEKDQFGMQKQQNIAQILAQLFGSRLNLEGFKSANQEPSTLESALGVAGKLAPAIAAPFTGGASLAGLAGSTIPGMTVPTGNPLPRGTKPFSIYG